MSKGQFSPQFFLESYVYNIRIVLPETSTLYQHDIGYLLQPNVYKKRTFWHITFGKDTWLSQMPLYEVEKTLTSKYWYVISYLKTRRDLHLLSLVDNWINYIYNCRFIQISSLLFERIIREANDIFVVQNTMIIIL